MLMIYMSAVVILVFGLLAIYSFIEFKYKEKQLPNVCEYENLRARLAAVTDALEQKVEERDEAIQTIEDGRHAQSAIDFYESNKGELLQMESEIKKLESIKGEYELYQDKLANTTEEYNSKRMELLPLEGKFNDLKAETLRLEEKKNEQHEEGRALEIHIDTLKKEYFGLKKDVEKISAEVTELREQRADLHEEFERKQALISVFETKKETLQKEIEILDESVKKARATADRHGGIHNREETLKDLWDPIKFPHLVPTSELRSEHDSTEYARNYIKGMKLHFPERTFNAFHTAMKCNDISPMSVLAGISGTGKSELPKRYAEGMGIHFSMLAVQPRWDSPQDLLGFYNYMEHRYKATELARALVRFDPHNRGLWGTIPDECDDRSDRMLMVLLDEMNLARVEYYFSEFLSKLETRRGVNLSDRMDRNKAEIELEIGSSLGSMHLFPGRNILFAGTMNEDESTQSLSDKVLDRASVLRFGKPHKTNIAMNAPQIAQCQDGLLYSNWQDWVTDFKEVSADSDVNSWIHELNDAMGLLKKPFGHRVAQAIASYVANYPKWVHDWKRKAFADQIEQRILPKLRGVDLVEGEAALNKISRLIDTSHDETLGAEFKKGMSDNMHGIFMWHGIDRSQEA